VSSDYWIKNNKIPFQVQFYLKVHYQPTDISFHWDFGDGTSSDEQEPVHIYTHTGIYNVKVEIVNYKTVEEKDFTIDVSKSPMPILSSFDYESTHGKYYAPCEIKFYNTSQYASNFFWTFGDQRGSAEDSPTHIYDTSGVYDVRLYAISNSDTAVSLIKVSIDQPPYYISIDKVSVWLPDDLMGATYALHYYTDRFNETPTDLGTVTASDKPFGWIINKNLYYFDGVYDSRPLYFEVWNVNDNQAPTYSFGKKFSEIQNNFYPDTLFWDDGNGFAAEVLLSYGNKKKKKMNKKLLK
jgi:PKD repeat protein